MLIGWYHLFFIFTLLAIKVKVKEETKATAIEIAKPIPLLDRKGAEKEGT